MKLYPSLALAALVLSPFAQADVVRNKSGNAPVRPYLFVDDNWSEAMPREKMLPSQRRTLKGQVPKDAREYLLRDRIDKGANQAGDAAYEEILRQEIVPLFAKLIRADLGTTESPIGVLKSTITVVAQKLREKLGKIEEELSTPYGPRHIVWLVAPWQKSEGADLVRERYSPGQLGFNAAARTPTRNFAAKHWLFDTNNNAISAGVGGELFHQVRTWAEWTSSHSLQESCTEAAHSTPPYVYPTAFLVHFRIAPGASSMSVQMLLGLHPMIQPLEKTQSDGAEIRLAGVAEPVDLDPQNPQYPMMLATYHQGLREQPGSLRLHLDFGTFEGYSPIKRELSLSNGAESGTWRATPFLGGDFILGKSSGYLTHLRMPVRVHLASFDVVVDLAGKKVAMERLRTGVELHDCQNSKVPLSTGLKVGIGKGGATEGAAAKLQLAINEKIEQMFAEAGIKARDQAMKKFPLAVLFMDGAL